MDYYWKQNGGYTKKKSEDTAKSSFFFRNNVGSSYVFKMGNDCCVYLITLRLNLHLLLPMSSLNKHSRVLISVFCCETVVQRPPAWHRGQTQPALPNTSSSSKKRGRRRALAAAFRGVTALNKRSISTAVSLAPLQLRGLKRVVVRSPTAPPACAQSRSNGLPPLADLKSVLL